jgi:hypothetical protein
MNLERTIHAHLTLSETIMDVADIFYGSYTDIYPEMIGLCYRKGNSTYRNSWMSAGSKNIFLNAPGASKG